MSNTLPLLRNCCISCSGLDPKEKSSIHKRVENLDGCVSLNLTTAVTHVIMRDSNLSSVKYKMAARFGIPVVTVQFIVSCEIEAKRLGKTASDCDIANAIELITQETRLPPFSGCHVSATGVSHDLLEDIKHLVVNSEFSTHERFGRYAKSHTEDGGGSSMAVYARVGGGGTYHNSLTRRCTHLIAADCTSQKFVFAKQWKIHIVSVAWFLDSIKSQARQDETIYALAEDSASFPHIGGDYSSLDQCKNFVLSADPELQQLHPITTHRTTSVLTASLDSNIFPPNNITASAAGNNDVDDLPKGGNEAPEVDIDVDVSGTDLLPIKHRTHHGLLGRSPSRLLTRRYKTANDADAGMPPVLPSKLSNAQTCRARALSSDAKQLHVPLPLSEDQCGESGMAPCHKIVSSECNSYKHYGLPGFRYENTAHDIGLKRRRLFMPDDHRTPKSKTSATDSEIKSNKRLTHTVAQYVSSSPKLQLSDPLENPTQALDNISPISSCLDKGKDIGVLEPPAYGCDKDSKCIFSHCVFTSFGLPVKMMTILQGAVNANGGHYADLLNYAPQPGLKDEVSVCVALRGLVHNLRADKSANTVYLVVQLCGSSEFRECYQMVRNLHPRIQVVTECWVEQCIHDSVLYPDFWQIEQQSSFYPGLSPGQHILFKPISIGRPGDCSTVSLSISGYEGLERNHIGKLAMVLGIKFSERFSRRATHLVCHPPFKGTKYERALKWGTVVVDSTWIYHLAKSVQNADTFANLSTISVANESSHTFDRPKVGLFPVIEPPGQPEPGSVIQEATPHKQLYSVQAMETPSSKALGKQNGDTPGRTPMVVSLERNLRQAEKNNAISRQFPVSGVSVCLDHAANFGDSRGELQDEDAITQLSPTSSSRLEFAGSASNKALSSKQGKHKGLEHILEGVVISLASRIYHRKNELAALALQLGCRVLARLDPAQTTHLVHQSPREHETLRDYRSAIQNKIHVVSPWWLYACRDAHTRANETEFPYSYHPERRLKLAFNSPPRTHARPKHTARKTKETTLQNNDAETKSQPSKDANASTVVACMAGDMQCRTSRETSPAAEPVVFDNLLVKKTLRRHRRYRDMRGNLLATQPSDSGIEHTKRRNRTHSPLAAGTHETPPWQKPLGVEHSVNHVVLDKARDASHPKKTNIPIQACSLLSGRDNARVTCQPTDVGVLEHDKWWLSVESMDSSGQGTSRDNIISQDMGVSDVGDFGMPSTNTAKHSLTNDVCLKNTESQLQYKTRGSAHCSGHNRNESINSISGDSRSCGRQPSMTTTKLAEVDTRVTKQQHNMETSAQNPTSTGPLNVRIPTTIVYSEDADAISERDRLIHKLSTI